MERTDDPWRYLDIAVRGYVVPDYPEEAEDPRPRPKGLLRVPDHVLIFDTETTVDPTQRLLFGCWRYCRVNKEAADFDLTCVEEGLFFDDDLMERDPGGLRVLKEYLKGHPMGAIDREILDARRRLQLRSARKFVHDRLWKSAYSLRSLVVCFNFPFDISRLAFEAGEARHPKLPRESERYKPPRPDPFEGGFSFALWGYFDEDAKWQENTLFRPRVAVKAIDSKRALKGFRGVGEADAVDRIPEGEEGGAPAPTWNFRGHFLDLRTLAFVLTDEGHTLESACSAFGVSYTKRDVEHGRITPENIEYCREDVGATQNLCRAGLAEFLRHPVRLQATRAYSPATLGKSYLEAMNVGPILGRQDVVPKVLGWAMTAYFGGRAEARIRRVIVPVVYTDFRSMYPTVCGLMHIWDLLAAEKIETVDRTHQTTALLKRISLEACLDPELWPKLVGIAQVQPGGDVLPTRARYSGAQGWQIGVNPVYSDEPLWYPIADVVASTILTGRAPQLLQALCFEPRGRRNLRLTRLLGEVEIDPGHQDFFKAVVEERRRTELRDSLPDEEREWRSEGLKVLANATSYGIYAQMTRRELGGGRREQVTVHGLGEDPFRCPVAAPEDAGEYSFPPIASAITGAARLMLAILERLITDAAGTYAFCDTDSMAIVSTREGGLVSCPGGEERDLEGGEAVRALPWVKVDEIRRRFETLNPYDRRLVRGSILELEKENFEDERTRKRQVQLHCLALSAKRYALFEVGESGLPKLRKWSEHGLGHLLNPTNPEEEDRAWIRQSWEHVIERELGKGAPEPVWLERPAVARHTISTPHLLWLFERRRDSPYAERIKPFNFCNVAFVPSWERPAGEERMILFAPYEKNPSGWTQLAWTNRFSGRQYRITHEPSGGAERDGIVTVKTYRDLLDEHSAHPESKSCGPDGRPCGRATRGLLRRRPVEQDRIRHIGKETNNLENVRAGLVQDESEVLTEFEDPRRDPFLTHALPVLRRLGVREVARRTGFSPSSVSDVLSQRSRPHAKREPAYFKVAVEHAVEGLRTRNVEPPRDELTCLYLFLKHAEWTSMP